MDEIKRVAFTGIIGLISIGFVPAGCDRSDGAAGGGDVAMVISNVKMLLR